ncbi:anaerobic ribonucleoside-triphosphate reductase [Methanoculleus sp. YWC-01]|jgi:ribonucleoside-triphosphate reductase|uniref:Anaerobic ribonucleoside-triphosphate reductase n=1 Tax=Methanoculleus nereidis TaxID=2735141 RepID=A0ABU3YZT8_9EURY|nr:anaerobic ribonucleoside-triphosphate reductase [Methanoculleus sp. YWC-01]MCK9298396.1 anaerobic ribonucleoside-triphosphate reductase [Methanoculleus sp.]MDV4342065.1 anaerobic ribonucleoside-triphosphate reductase [Methanoculleus sp. YWC-01]
MRLTRKSTQATLFGEFVPTFPKVRTSRGYLLDWNRNRIVRQILEESRLVEVFYGYEGADEETAKDIARRVERKIQMLGLQSLSGPLIREIVNMTLLERGLTSYRNVCTRVGTPVFDAHLIDVGRGFEAHDNANLQENAETSHKKKADKISKEQYLLQLPPELADHHLRGDLHIHDLEYFGTRPFCIDGSTVVPLRMENRIRSTLLAELPIDGDAWIPQDLCALTPGGWRRVAKVTRRRVNPGEMFRIRTSGGRSLLVTGEHRIPVRTDEGMTIRRADEVRPGDALYRISPTSAVRGETIESIDLVRELFASVPTELLENVYVRGAEEIFAGVVQSGRAASYAEISRELGIEHRKQWYTRGIMPVALFNAFCNRYGIEDYAGVTIGAAGSEHELPALLTLTPELVRLLGFFVSEGNYNAVPAVGQYNLAITENRQASAIGAAACTALNTYATIAGGAPDTTTIYGIEVERNRALQVYFGGKVPYLLFRYVFAIPEGAAGKRLPWIVYHLDDVLLHEFLSALFTGDGSAYYRPEKSDCIVNYTTASPALRQELSLLLTTLGMTPHIVELYGDDGERRTLYRLQLNGRRNIEAFARYATFLDERQNHIDGFLSAVKERAAGEREEAVVEVSMAEPTGAYVYDLFLDGDGSEESHTFYSSDGLLIHNCQDWDLRYFFYYGLMPDGNGTKASVAGPAKRAEVAVLHAVKALGSAQTNFAGGQGYYNFLTFMAPFLEGMDYEEIKQLMQMFVYEMTQMMVARGGQVVFSSVQLSPGVPTLWRDKPCVYRGKVWNGEQAPLRTYGEFEREVRLLFKALMEVMLEGDYWGKPFSFPKPEISIEPDFLNEDEEFNREHPDLPTYQDLYLMTFELASKYGTPYYDNQIPPYRGAGEGISCYQCLAGDELVPIVDSNGRTRIQEIEDLFKDMPEENRQTDLYGTEFAPLDAKTLSVDIVGMTASLRPFRGVMRKKHSGEVLRITLESGRRITVTPDHPVFTLAAGRFTKTSARRLSTGDYLPVVKTAEFGSNPVRELDTAEALRAAGHAGEIVLRDGEVNIRNAKNRGLSEMLPVTQDFVRFLGYYLAEGCSDTSGRRYTVRLSFGKHEEDLIKDAAACIKGFLGYEPLISEEATAVNVTVNSKLLYLLLDAISCGKCAAEKNVPDLLFDVDRELVGTYLDAAFRGDGNISVQAGQQGSYIHRARSIRIKLVSRNAVQKLVWLAQRIGVQMNYVEQETTVTHPQTGKPYALTAYTCTITAQDQIRRFSQKTGYGTTAITGSSRQTGGIFTRLPIEASGLQYTGLVYASQYASSGHHSAQVSLIRPEAQTGNVERLINGDIHPVRIRSIERLPYDGYVYDLVDVADTHTFTNALGIVTGNCCAYQFSSLADEDDEFEDKLYFREGKHFSMGSWQVMSINCPRAAYKAEGDQERLFAELKSFMDIAVDLYRIKRRWMSLIRTNGRMPFAMQRPKDPNTGERGTVGVDLEGLVYTIGVVGVNEMVQHFTGHQLHESKEAFRLAVRAMTELEMYARELSKKHNMTIALARTPAETTGQRFAVADLLDERFREHALKVIKGDAEQALDMLGTTLDLPIYYTNGTHVAPGAPVPLTKRIEIEHIFFPIVDGGNIFHVWLGEARPDPRGLMEMAMNLCRTTQIGYFAFTRDLTVSLKEYREYKPVRQDRGTGAGLSPVADRADA